jgi:urea transport system permease protein
VEIVLLQAFNALSLSSILLLIALGLALSFGLMRVINMAHGEFMMLGAYTVYVLQPLFAPLGGPALGLYFVAALPLAFLTTALLGAGLERLVLRHLVHRPLDTLLATWGVGLVLQQAARSLFGAPNVQVTSPAWLNGGLAVLPGVLLSAKRLFILGLVLLCLGALFLYLYRTRGGRRLRAVMQDREMAACLGVPTDRVDALTFALGSGLAGVAGCALTLLGPIGPTLGTYYIVDAFLVVILGGVGQLLGTALAALTVGSLNTLFEFGSTATLGKALVFVLVIVFLQWRPAGLLAVRAR